VLLSAAWAVAQTSAPAAKPAAPKTGPTVAAKPASLPTEAEVNEFFRHMFGFDPNTSWTIQAIVPGDAPGVAHVVATIAGQQRPTNLYILPGGKFAVVGDAIPFGADPFAPLRAILNTKAKGPTRGPAAATVTIVEFSDLQCPFCRSAQPTIDRLTSDFPNVRLVFQPFPLTMHKWALKAASYAECVHRQRPAAFWDFINGVYDGQATVTEANADAKLAAAATAAGVDAPKAAACAEQPDVYLAIQRSLDFGKSIGVNSTPTLYLNGRKISNIGDLSYEQLKAMLQFEISEAGKK
jgi:protein-disulfide isomerase